MVVPTQTHGSVMYKYKCDDKEFWLEKDLFRYMRQECRVDVRAAPFGRDSHNHMYYCMSCESNNGYRNHRSFDSEQAIVDHCRDRHDVRIRL